MNDFYSLKDAVSKAPMECHTRGEIWHEYLSNITDGVALEFGVWNGRSINYMAEVRPKASFYGFDSFEGLPEDWIPGHPAGHFRTDDSKIRWRENVTLVKGWFDQTVADFTASPTDSKKLQGIHIDCDLGSSTKTVLDGLTERILRDKPVLLFDEFYNYRGFEDHEFKAFMGWANANAVSFDILARNVKHQQVLIRLV